VVRLKETIRACLKLYLVQCLSGLSLLSVAENRLVECTRRDKVSIIHEATGSMKRELDELPYLMIEVSNRFEV